MKHRLLKTFSFIMMVAIFISSTQVTLSCIASDLHMNESVMDQTLTETTDPVNIADTSEYEEEAYIIGEDETLRKENEKHFRLSDGTYIAVAYAEPVHYMDDGEWKDIDNTLTLTDDGYVNTANDFTVTFGTESTSSELYTLTDGEHTVKMYLKEQSSDGTATYALRPSNNRKIAVKECTRETADSFDVMSSADSVKEFKENNPHATDEQISEIVKVQNEENKRQREFMMKPKNMNSSLEFTDIIGNVDIEYVVTSTSVKENIILESADDGNVFEFVLDTELDAVLNDDGTIDLKDGEDTIFSMPAPYMYDANGEESTDVEYSLTTVDGKTVLTVTADEEWINDSNRAFPVTIDPTVSAGKTDDSDWNIITQNICEEDLVDANQGAEDWLAGYTPGTGEIYSYLKVQYFPEIPYNCTYIGASIHMFMDDTIGYISGGASEFDISVREAVAGDWVDQFDSTGTTNNNPIVDYVTVSESTMGGYVDFDITNVANDWRRDSTTNTGLVFTSSLPNGGEMSSTNYAMAIFKGYINNTTDNDYMPYFSVYYKNYIGIEGYYTYHTASADRAGSAYINDYTGNLTIVRSLISGPGADLSFVYNSPYGNETFTSNEVFNTVDYSNMRSANGWRLNYQQSLVEKSLKQHNGTDITSVTHLVYSDEDGTEHYFSKDSDGVYKDEDGLGFEITGNFAKYTMTDDKDNKKIFIYGYLSELVDSNGNKTVLLYDTTSYSSSSSDWKPKSSTSGGKNQLRKIIYIPDGESPITVATLTYNSTTKQLTTITDRANRTLTLGVNSDGYLTSLTDFDGAECRYRYSAFPNSLRDAYDVESEYGLKFAYNPDYAVQVQTYWDYTVAAHSFDSESAKDLKNEIWRSEAGQTARFRHTGGDQTIGTADDVLTTYVFDAQGRTITTRSEDNNGNTIGIAAGTYTQNNGTEKTNNKLTKEGGTGALAQNLLMNSGMEDSDLPYWYVNRANKTNYTFTSVTNEAHTGNKAVKLTSTAMGGWMSFYQKLNITTAGTYTFSAYVKVTDMGSTSVDGSGFRIAIKNTSDDNLAKSRYIKAETSEEVDDGWVRLFCTCDISATGEYLANFAFNGTTGTIYIDDAQLEKNSSASPYNLVQNGYFSGTTSWGNRANASVVTTTQPNKTTGTVLKLNGGIRKQAYAAQTVPINLPSTETYILSGWAKAESVAAPNQNTRTFQITATIKYSDGTTEDHTNRYSYYTWDEWHYVSAPIAPKEENKTVSSITVTCSYKFNANTAYFDDVSLIREATQSYTYDDDGNLVAVNQTKNDELSSVYEGGDLLSTTGGANGSYEYTYDDNHNITKASNNGVDMHLTYDAIGNVKSTKIQGSDGKFMSTSATYTDGGTKTATVTDNLGNVTSNTYYTERNLLKTTTYDVSNSNTDNDATAMTQYNYDGANRMTHAYEAGEIALVYTYDMGNTASILRRGFLVAGNNSPIEQTYSFTYNDYGQTTATKVGSRTLVTNTYSSSTHNLLVEYYGANGYVRYTYDNLDRIKTVRYNNIDTLVTYTYDYMGNVAVEKVTNIAGTTEYATYYYEYDSLGRPVRYFETLEDEIVQQVQYTYDSKNRTTSVSYYDGAEMRTATATYNETSGILTKYDFGGDEGAIGYQYDKLNRANWKYFRRDADGTTNDWVVTYAFKNGEATNQTTSLVSQLKYSLDRNDSSKNYTLNYTYDNLGNITKVTRVENNGTEEIVARYMYDENGQLVYEEIRDAAEPYSMVYTYDTYGNIRKAEKYDSTGFSSPSVAYGFGTLLSTETYGYTDSSWKDLLTSYNGHTITYDAMGNPLTYYNGQDYTFTWENGNQLASTVTDGKTVTYEYNADGIRTSKNVFGISNTDYRLDGSKVVEMERRGTYETSRYVFVYDEAGNPHELHSYSGSSSTPTKFYYVLNVQGDVVQLRDSNNTVIANYTYDAWGKLLSVTNANGNEITDTDHIAHLNPIRYRGYFYDNETGLYYCNSRYYDPQIRRFINADDLAVLEADITNLAQYNLFAYCLNNPVNMDDEGGQWPKWAKKAVAAVAVVAVVAAAAAISVATAGAGAPISCALIGAAQGAAVGLVSGAVSGAATGAVTHRLTTGSWKGAGQAALNGAADGALSGAITGAITGGIKSPHCFVAGTAIVTAAGYVAIENITAGDVVFAWNETTDEVELKRVVETYENETDELIHLYVNGEKITTTPSHPFYSPVKGWTDAVNLRAGDMLVLVNGEYVVLEKVQHEILESPITVYNFQVEDDHTYYVGESGILVHNACRGQLKQNMLKQGSAPGSNYQAHHGLPWKHQKYFAQAGLDVNDARFGRWVIGGGNGGHQSWSSRYGRLWDNYVRNHPEANAADIIDYFNKLNGVR